MYPVTDSFISALSSPSMVSRIKITASDGTSLSVQEGSVNLDSRRDTTRTCELEIVPTTSMTASAIYNLVMTPGIEISVSRGLLINGSVEYVPLGVFITDQADYDKAQSATVRWSGSDRSKRISRAKFVDPYQIAAGTTLASAITNLLQSRWPLTVVDLANVTETITNSITFEAGDSTDPWTMARQIMTDYGYDLNFNGIGVCRAVTIQDPALGNAVFDFGSGSTNIVTGGTIQGTMEETFNGVIASGEASGNTAPVRAIAWDTDPGSPTFYQSGFGQVPLFYSSPLLTSVEMCQQTAAAMLAKMKGRSDGFTWPSIVNPALEPLDLVTVTLDGITSRLVIDSLTIPLKASDAMTANARLTSTL